LFFLASKRKEIKNIKSKSKKKINNKNIKTKTKTEKDPNSPFAVLEKLL